MYPMEAWEVERKKSSLELKKWRMDLVYLCHLRLYASRFCSNKSDIMAGRMLKRCLNFFDRKRSFPSDSGKDCYCIDAAYVILVCYNPIPL